jgi:hypothetical protein
MKNTFFIPKPCRKNHPQPSQHLASVAGLVLILALPRISPPWWGYLSSPVNEEEKIWQSTSLLHQRHHQLHWHLLMQHNLISATHTLVIE